MDDLLKNNKIEKIRSIFSKIPPIVLKKPTIVIKKNITSPYTVAIGGTKTAYLRSHNLATKFSQIDQKKFKTIFFCIYRVRTEPENEPFLEYLLYKYPKKDKDVCIFPFIKQTKTTSIQKIIFSMMIDTLKQPRLKWAYKGYVSDENNLYLFIKLTGEKRKLFSQRVLERNTKWWWAIIDEVCNSRHILNFPIHKIVTQLFLANPILIYLKDTMGQKKPIPRSLYYGRSAQFIPFNFVFGPKIRSKGLYGPYYYLGNYNKAIRYAGWTVNYNKLIKGNVAISDDNGKIYKGGIVRYAVFLGKRLKVLLNHPDDIGEKINPKLDKILPFQQRLSDREGKWAKDYDSLYYGRAEIPEIKNGIWRYYPGFVTKLFKQQIPLTMHIVDEKTLKINWERDNDKYYIK